MAALDLDDMGTTQAYAPIDADIDMVCSPPAIVPAVPTQPQNGETCDKKDVDEVVQPSTTEVV